MSVVVVSHEVLEILGIDWPLGLRPLFVEQAAPVVHGTPGLSGEPAHGIASLVGEPVGNNEGVVLSLLLEPLLSGLLFGFGATLPISDGSIPPSLERGKGEDPLILCVRGAEGQDLVRGQRSEYQRCQLRER